MARSNRRSKRNRRRPLDAHITSIEQLETRQLLTGQVSVTVEDGNVTITGDVEANALELTVFKGDVSLRSRAGTQINGQTGRTVLFEGTDTIPGNVTVKLGDGRDTFLVTRELIIGGNFLFAGGGANDNLGMLRTTVNGDLKILMGTGRDGVSIDDIYVGGSEAMVRGNNGWDSMQIEGSRFVPGLDLDAGGGRNDLVLTLVRTDGDASIKTSDRSDLVAINSGRFKAGLRVVTGKGTDTVRVLDTRVATTTLVSMGADDDQLLLGAAGQRNIFSGDFEANGAGGSDTYDQRANVFKSARTVRRFSNGDTTETGLQNATARAAAVDLILMELFRYREQVLTAEAVGTETVGGVVTQDETTTVSGETTNDALVEVDLDDDGQFDDLTLRADEFGDFSFPVELPEGHTDVRIRTTDDVGFQQTFETIVHRAVGTVVRFQTSLGFFDAELLDEDAPLTVANYLDYVDSDSFGIVHRSVDDFVIQGGGFEFKDGQLGAIDKNDPVENEFSEENSNLRGTLSTALQANSPDSATNQWFVNLEDNTFLDDAQHTVFGRVIAGGMDVVDTIGAVDQFNLDGGVFSQTPLRDFELYSQQLTGTVSTTLGSSTLTGTDTLFTDEVTTGQIIQVRDGDDVIGTFQVTEIVSDTELTLSSTAAETSSGAIVRHHEEIGPQHFVFSDIEELFPDS